MKKEFFRDRRVGELLREEIANLIQFEVKNEDLHGVIITEVTVTKDLSLARVYFRSVESRDLEQLKYSLDKVKSFIFSRLKKSIRIKKIPNLEFIPDHSLDYAEKIEDLIKKIQHTE
ncbi:MAG: 30S ribosome-binding factor RbfA [Deferribacterales bacterium]